MKLICSAIFSLLLLFCYSQESQISYMLNRDLVTYIDNTEARSYTVSIPGDTMIETEIPGVFRIDSSIYQFLSFPISEKFYDHKYRPGKERFLLKAAMRYEHNYQQKEVFKEKLPLNKEFHLNAYGKQFLIWNYTQPNTTNDTSYSYYENDTTLVNTYVVQYHLFLSFISNSYTIMISSIVYDFESLERRINSMKEISNTVRVFAGEIQEDVLYKQITYKQNEEQYLVIDSILGIKFEIPFWMNNIKGKYELLSTLPDINNVSNALSIMTTDQEKFDSFQSFRDNLLESKEVLEYESVFNENQQLHCYKTIYQASHGVFTCQYIFFECTDRYGLINFTATADTYDQNLDKLNEFLDGIEFFDVK